MGVLSPTGLDWEPYGELPFLELVNIYAHRAFELLEAGVSALWVEGALSLGEARAAVLGARQTGLPIHLTMAVDADGESPQNADVLASLVTLQGLGIQSFGLAFTGGEKTCWIWWSISSLMPGVPWPYASPFSRPKSWHG